MVSTITFLSLILASALPGAFAAPINLCKRKTVEVYRKNLPTKSDFYASGTADAFGENTYTYSDQYLFQVNDYNDYTAYVGGNSDTGYVYLYNNGNGQVLDCDRIWELQFVAETKGTKKGKCFYEVDLRSRKACDIAAAHFDAYGYATGGDAYADLSVYSIQETGFSSTNQFLYASGNESAGGYLWNYDFVEDQNGNNNGATSTVSVDCSSDTKEECNVTAYTYTVAYPGYSSSSAGVSSSSGRRLL